MQTFYFDDFPNNVVSQLFTYIHIVTDVTGNPEMILKTWEGIHIFCANAAPFLCCFWSMVGFGIHGGFWTSPQEIPWERSRSLIKWWNIQMEYFCWYLKTQNWNWPGRIGNIKGGHCIRIIIDFYLLRYFQYTIKHTYFKGTFQRV